MASNGSQERMWNVRDADQTDGWRSRHRIGDGPAKINSKPVMVVYEARAEIVVSDGYESEDLGMEGPEVIIEVGSLTMIKKVASIADGKMLLQDLEEMGRVTEETLRHLGFVDA